jgi:hypothetical protein
MMFSKVFRTFASSPLVVLFAPSSCLFWSIRARLAFGDLRLMRTCFQRMFSRGFCCRSRLVDLPLWTCLYGCPSPGCLSTAVPLRPSLVHFRLPLHGFPHLDQSTGLTLILPPPRKVRGCPAGPAPSLSALASLNEQQAQTILAESPKALALLAYHTSTIDKNSKLNG